MTLLVTVLKRPHVEEAQPRLKTTKKKNEKRKSPWKSPRNTQQGTRNTDCTGHERMQRTHMWPWRECMHITV